MLDRVLPSSSVNSPFVQTGGGEGKKGGRAGKGREWKGRKN